MYPSALTSSLVRLEHEPELHVALVCQCGVHSIV